MSVNGHENEKERNAMKKRITALALAALMVMGTVAVAAGTEKTITVTPMGLNVNGQVVTPTKSDGTPAEVFAYEGATYAPLRYLTELNGNQVVWDASDPNTAKITTAAGYTYADTIAWDGQYDVVVAGFGGAGAVAASTAAKEGAKVLLVEKASEGHEGGNTRVCGQLFAYGHEDEEATYNYYKALAGGHEVPEAMLRVYTKSIAHMNDVMEDLLGIPQSQYIDWTGKLLGAMSPEYPEFPGADKISLNSLHEGFSDSFLWQNLRKLVTDRSDSIDVWFESPAVHLIQDPVSKTILGVQVERNGKTVNIRATNGVILTTGGFENNPEMIANYLGLSDYTVCGGLYNTGDGVRMAQEVGANLWHMEAYEGIGSMGGTSVSLPDEYACGTTTLTANGAFILVGGAGERYLDESEGTRHGHINMNDLWLNVRRPQRSFFICDEAAYNANASRIPSYALNVQHASSIKELAKLIDVDPDALDATVKNFNSYAKSGNDPEFGRKADTMSAFTGTSFYAIAANANVLNTQGGPQRNENAQVIGLDGNPIPHLYSAGELGGITACQYQGGGNIAECVIFGQIAGKNAAAKKDALPAYQNRVKVTSTLTYTPGKTSDIGGAAAEIATGSNEYLGVSHNGMGGDLQVKVTMENGKIAKVEIVKHNETAGISDPAREQLPDAIVKVGSTNVDNVSGASVTSRAIKEAVEDALSQVK